MKYLLSLLPLALAFYTPPASREFKLSGYAQGTTWSLTYYATGPHVSRYEIDSIFSSIDSSLSLYKPYSLINRFNSSPQGIRGDRHFINVIKKSIRVYRSTNGLFDITVQPLVKAWGFGTEAPGPLPDSQTIKSLLQCVGTPAVSIRRDSIIKRNPCITIDVNGIAQGYSVDVIARFLESKGIHNYLAELGGEIRVKGRKLTSGEQMKIGIETPADEDSPEPVMNSIISISRGAITTSGNYRKYYLSQGKKISHIINPLTGFPVSNELVSVTVYAPDAITSDAYDNALMLMGLEEAMKFVEKRKRLAAHFIYIAPSGEVKDTATRRFPKPLPPKAGNDE